VQEAWSALQPLSEKRPQQKQRLAAPRSAENQKNPPQLVKPG
jgi:hypothetical protein